MSASAAFDAMLAFALLINAALLLTGTHFLRTIVLFVTFGLLMALVWARLMAPDIALAEAAIGTGITGVLLVDALRHIEWGRSRKPPAVSDVSPPNAPRNLRRPLLALVPALALFALLAVAALHVGDSNPGMATRVEGAKGEIEHPVTAVLLVFRSFDTMLELGVLLLAVLGMLAVRGHHPLAAATMRPPRDPLLESVVRLLVPLAVLIAGYLLWLGTFGAGGAFQSGVILGAAGILLWLTGHRSIEAVPGWLWQTWVLLGFSGFLLTATITLFWSAGMLHYPPRWQGTILLVIETAAAISIGATFTALFVGIHPGRDATDVEGARETSPSR